MGDAKGEMARSRRLISETYKLGIALKELRESRSWIQLIVKGDLLPELRMAPLLDEAQQLCNIVGKSIVTAKANQEQADP